MKSYNGIPLLDIGLKSTWIALVDSFNAKKG